ncbi:toll/interleukin-1 receptor domain-containing protein [Nocardia sp. NPDC057455]|uniref:toll/interleukin-1 receptor domain-containing protein n=1 Tax=Nocardia sp. NPDC057455 TaxID=3346138 RepID=UPI00366EE557
MNSDIDVFLSYARKADEDIAPALQQGLARLAKPWNRPRALRVFRDRTDLSAAHDLTAEIEDALRRSRYFVLLASPQAAQSQWVGKEIEYWKEHKSPETLLIALTHGEIVWRDDDFDWTETTSLPRSLSGYFDAEPIWEDFRFATDADRRSLRHAGFRSAVASLAARPRGVPKEQLDSADVRLHRAAVRLRRAAVSGLAVLLVLALVAGAGFLVQRNDARQQRDVAQEQNRIASARLMSARADNLMATDVRGALLLAVAGYRTDPSSQALSTLLRANLAAPALRGYLKADAAVTGVETSRDGRTVLAKLADNRVVRWTEGEQTLSTLATLDGPARSISMNADATVIAMTDRSRVTLWRSGTGTVTLELPDGSAAGAITTASVSPSGKTVVAALSSGDCAVFDASTAALRTIHHAPSDFGQTIATSDDEIFRYDSTYGKGERRNLHDWSVTAAFRLSFGNHELGSDPTGDAAYLGATNGNPSIPVWPTSADRPDGDSGLTVEVPRLYRASPTVLSEDGTTMAVAQDGDIYIAPVAPRGTPRPDPVVLSGGGTISSTGLLRFLGPEKRGLVSAYDDLIAIWNLDQIDRLARSASLPITDSCGGCAAPSISVAPNAETAVIGGADLLRGTSTVSGTLVEPLRDIEGPRHAVMNLEGIPVWSSPTEALLISTDDPQAWSTLPEHLEIVQIAEHPATARIRSDGKTVATVDGYGRLHVYEIATGKPLPGRDSAEPPFDRNARIGQSAIDVDGRLAAVLVGNHGVVVLDVESGRRVGEVRGDDIATIAYAGSRLLIERANGSLEIWKPDASEMQAATAADRGYPLNPYSSRLSGADDGSLIARVRKDGSIVLADAASGITLAHIPAVNPGEIGKTGVGLSPDGGYLVTVTEGAHEKAGKLVERAIDPTALIRTACDAAAGDLSPDEWKRIIGIPRPASAGCPAAS